MARLVATLRNVGTRYAPFFGNSQNGSSKTRSGSQNKKQIKNYGSPVGAVHCRLCPVDWSVSRSWCLWQCGGGGDTSGARVAAKKLHTQLINLGSPQQVTIKLLPL